MNQQDQYTLTGLHTRIREARRAKGFQTQGAICELLGVSRQLWSMIELGKRVPRLIYLVQLANLLDIDFNYFVREDIQLEDAMNPASPKQGKGI